MTPDFPSHETFAFSSEKLHEFAASAEHSLMKRDNQYCGARHLLRDIGSGGETGAAAGTQVFTPIQNHRGKRWTFIIPAICEILVTWILVPNLQGEDLAVEDEEFRAFPVANGWTGVMGEDDLETFEDQGIPTALTSEDGYVADEIAGRKAHLITG